MEYSRVCEMYICVCSLRVPNVKEVIELAGNYIVVPFSNSQARRIADMYGCTPFYVNDVDAVKQLVEVLARFIGSRKYEIVEINDIRWYPHIVDSIEVLVDDNEVYVEYYSTEDSDGYYAKHKKSNIEVNVTNPC